MPVSFNKPIFYKITKTTQSPIGWVDGPNFKIETLHLQVMILYLPTIWPAISIIYSKQDVFEVLLEDVNLQT